MRQGYPLSQVLFNIDLEFLARPTKGIQTGKKIVKVSLFSDNIILYIKDPKNS
jgi:hypothetical protein